jgi:hypothetical protein
MNGSGAMVVGNRSEPFTVICRRHDTAANIAAWFAQLCALSGTIVSITDDWGLSYDGALVRKAGRPHMAAAVLGAKTCLGSMVLECQRQTNT